MAVAQPIGFKAVSTIMPTGSSAILIKNLFLNLIQSLVIKNYRSYLEQDDLTVLLPLASQAFFFILYYSILYYL